jgi:hypothetical protein
VQPESALAACHRLLASDLVVKDRGLPSALMLGLPRAAEREPEAVEELLELLVRDGSLPIAEVLLDLRRERLGEDFAVWAAQRARVQLREALAGDDREDEGKAALMIAVANELGRAPGRRRHLAAADGGRRAQRLRGRRPCGGRAHGDRRS